MPDPTAATPVTLDQDVEPDVSVLIVGFNCRDLLADCLDHLFASTGPFTFEVLFLENGHGDDSVAMVQDRYPRVRVIDNTDNLGFGRGNNVLARHALGRYVLLLNPDTRIAPDAVGCLLRYADAHPDAGAVGGVTLRQDGSIEPSCVQAGPSFLVAFMNAIGLGRYFCSHTAIPDQPVRARVLSGAFMMLPRVLWGELGGFDESYFLYNEEADLCMRVAEQRRSLWLVPDARVVHLVGGGDGLRPERLMAMTRSQMHLTRRRFAPWRWPVYGSITLLHAGTRYFGSWMARPMIGAERAAKLRRAFGPVLFHPGQWWRGYESIR